MPGTVIDPFLGAGTVAGVAEHLGLCWKGVELNPEYAQLLPERVAEVQSYYARWAGKGRGRDPSAPRLKQLTLLGAST